MTDPRNIAHDKRVQQEKKHRHQEGKPGASQKFQPGRKPQMKQQPRVENAPPEMETTQMPDDSGDAQG